MQLLRPLHRVRNADPAKRGAALLLSFMVLVVIVTIITQISIGTMTDARVARNDLALAKMDLAIESAMMQSRINLRDDGAADAEAEGEGDEGAGPSIPDIGDLGSEGDEEGGDEEAPADKKADFPIERTEFNDISLRILVQDEDSKYNVLNMVLEDEERAEEGYQSVVRVLDLFREGTEFDLALPDAQEVAEAMRRHMLERDAQVLPKPPLLSDLADNEQLGLPLGMREFLVQEEVPEILFKDFRDENDVIVHSIESFLTVHSSLKRYSGAPTDGLGLPSNDEGAQGSDGPTSNGSDDSDAATGGFAVNINTAPPVVLKSLFDDREVNPAFWDEVIEFRNLEDEEAMQDEDGQRREPILDEYGDEVLELQFFGTLEDLDEIRGWGDFDTELQERIKERLTTRSSSFSIIVTALRKTSADRADEATLDPRDAAKAEETSPALRRVIRQIVFRHTVDEEVEVTPVVPWEALPSSPYEVVDYPDEDR